MFTFTKKSPPPGLPNLGAQIRYAQNQYTTVQMDLKYPLLASFCVRSFAFLTSSSFSYKYRFTF